MLYALEFSAIRNYIQKVCCSDEDVVDLWVHQN